MRNSSLSVALTAILLLSNTASARQRKRVADFEAPTVSIIIATADVESTSLSPGATRGNAGADEQAPAVNTVTVVPLPAETADGVFYPGLSTGSSAAYPTGHHHRNHTANHTHHGSTNSADVNATSTTIPSFTLQNTASITIPTIAPESTPALPKSRFPQAVSSLNVPAPSNAAQPSTSIQAATNSSESQTQQVSASAESGTQTSLTSSTASPGAMTNGKTPFLRGVNLGGWLVLEKWMNNETFSGNFSKATDQYTFDSIPGAEKALKNHWDTFFTESDIQKIASTGINALRIPIGFWAYDNDNTPYIKGADAYLEEAIGWARKAGVKVWVDCHGSPGSQNGFDNSGHAGNVDWQSGDNMDRSIAVLKTMAKKYGATEYADVVVGLELTNEPISWGNNQFSKTQSWAQDAYKAVKAASSNPNLVIVMHDAFKGVSSWTDIGKTLNSQSRTFGVDTHMYQLFSDADNALTQSQHITKACGWGAELATANAVLPAYVGEWSAATNICVNPDSTTTAGTSCSTEGCQCQSAPFNTWNDKLVEQARRYTEAQLDTFEQNASGYFIWSAKGPGGWGFLNGISNGAIPNPITDRKYPGQCGGKRRMRRGGLRAEPEAF